MIKKIIACLTICFIITGILSPVFSDASALPQPNWSDPGISEIINISDLTGWMLNGGTYDVSTYTDAESFMNDYYAARTKTRLEGSDYQVKSSFGLEQQYYQVGDSAYAHELDVNRVIASSYRDHSGYGRRFSEQVNDALLSTGNLYDTKIPLLNEIEFANFVGYNHDALKIYASQFINTDIPTPNPDPEFSTMCQMIGSPYFGNIDTKCSIYTTYSGLTLKPDSCVYSEGGNLFSIGNNGTSTYSVVTFFALPSTINLNGSDNSWTATYTGFDTVGRLSNDRSNFNQLYVNYNSGTCTYSGIYSGRFNNAQTSFNGLSIAINYFYSHFRNVSLYVNGVLWAYPDTTPIPTITPEFPDAVGGEDLPSTTWPVHRPIAPYFITAPGMLQAIQDAIDDDGELDIDDLKPYLTDENGDPVPDPQFDPEPVPIPVPDPVNPDVVPGLPFLPAMPPEMPGFSGVSVLAEIINFTNQSLPTSLIATFWGIVFGIVILGLIKILHK